MSKRMKPITVYFTKAEAEALYYNRPIGYLPRDEHNAWEKLIALLARAIEEQEGRR